MKPGDLVQLNVDYWRDFPSLTVHRDGKMIGYKAPSADDFGKISYVDVDLGWHGIITEVTLGSVKVMWPNGQSTLTQHYQLTPL